MVAVALPPARQPRSVFLVFFRVRREARRVHLRGGGPAVAAVVALVVVMVVVVVVAARGRPVGAARQPGPVDHELGDGPAVGVAVHGARRQHHLAVRALRAGQAAAAPLVPELAAQRARQTRPRARARTRRRGLRRRCCCHRRHHQQLE